VTLTAAAGQTYAWSNGDTTQSITVNQAGSYYAVVTTSNGCVDTTATYTTTVFADPDTAVTASGSLNFCSYEDVTLTAAAGQNYLWSNGDTTQSITVNQPGSYQALVTSADGCTGTTAFFNTTVFASPDISVTTSQAPKVIWGPNNVNNSIDTIPVLTTNGIQLDINHVDVNPNGYGSIKFNYSDGTTDEFKFWGNGGMRLWNPATSSFTSNNYTVGVHSLAFMNIANTAKSYYVECTNVTGVNTWVFKNLSSGLVSVVLEDNASWNGLIGSKLTELPGPGSSLDFCSYESVTLTAAAGQTYAWSNGDTTQSITVNQAGSYYAVVTTSNGCVDTTATYTTTVFADPDTAVTASGSLDFCNGGSVTLTAAAGQTYAWSDGSSSQAITLSQAGSYYAVVTTSNGCVDTTATYTTTVFADADTSVTVSGPLSFCNGGSVTLTAASGQTYVWSNGATTQSITVTQSGTYSAIVTTNDGCVGTTASYSTSVFTGADTTVTASGPLSFCNGGSVTLVAAPGQTYVWSNGATTQGILVNQAGAYSATVTTSDGCIGTTAVFTTSIFLGADTSVTASGPLSFCAGGSVNFSAASGQSYLWNTGDTTQSISVNTSGTYSALVMTNNGCVGTTSPRNVNIYLQPDTSVVVSQSLFCASDSAILTADPNQSYLWNTGETSQSIVVNTTGNYFVNITTADGCTGVSDSINITVVPDIVMPQIVSNGLGWVTSGASSSFTIVADSNYTYQWGVSQGAFILNGQGTDSINVFWGPSDSNIAVWLIVSNGVCSDSVGITITISGVGLDTDDMGLMQLYPNPNDGRFIVRMGEEQIGASYRVIDFIGRSIAEGEITSIQQSFDLADKPKGTYRIQIINSNGIKTLSVVIQ
jgi:hypothetical protein